MGWLFTTIFFVLKHKAGAENWVAYALSRNAALLNVLVVTATGLETIKTDYATNPKLGQIYTALTSKAAANYSEYSLKDGYLFWRNQLCLPATSIRDFITKEMHLGGIACYYGQNKTI